MSGQGLILSCSPRANGNCDQISLFARNSLAQAQAVPSQVVRLADVQINGCISCDYCLTHPGVCSLDLQTGPDSTSRLVATICTAEPACLVSPIYFYHLPGKTKSLLDRSQAFHLTPAKDKPGQGRKLGVILIAGRPVGDKLFAGSLLTLKYVCFALGLQLAEPLLLRGLDLPGDFGASSLAQQAVQEYAAYLAGFGER